MNKGFLIYAIGHSNYYQMAETLAASIKFNNPEASICLVVDDPGKVEHKHLLDSIVQIEVAEPLVFNDYTIQMYDHSPYEQTIKIDADTIWLNDRNPMDLFDLLAPYDVMHMNRGHGWNTGKSVWADEDKLKKVYKFTDEDKLYKIYGEFVYFNKSERARIYFETVQKIYNKPRIKMYDGFSNGGFTDELAYQIASIKNGMEYIDNFTPIMNKYLDYRQWEHVYAYQLPSNFYAYSIGGNATPSAMKEQYNLLAKHYYHQLGLQNPYQVRDKRTFLPERKKR